MKNPHLSIIIPALNLWEMTSSCLRSLREFTSGNFFEVIVVDNGSTDSTPTECPVLGNSLFGERFKFVRVDENINFGPACNLGAVNAAGEMLFFLNNDTLLSKDWVVPLLESFRNDPVVKAASPLCLFPNNGRVQYMGIGYTGSLWVCHPYFMFPGKHPVVRKLRRFQALSATALMVPTQVFKQLNGFFPEYANGFEDMDLCCRIRRAGGRLVQENKSVIYHWASKTPGRNLFDSDNMKLINRRCIGCFKPDLHRIALDDGFRCELTPWLEMIMKDESVPKKLNQLSEESELLEAVDKYPLWENGYEKISELYCGQGRLHAAAEVLFYGVTFFPDLDRYRRLEELALQAGISLWAELASEKAAGIRRTLQSPEILKKQAEKVFAWAKEDQDTELLEIYERWIQQH